MKKLFGLVATIAGLLLAACDTAPPTDWCYIFDFKASQNGFSLPAGAWVENEGLVTDETGLLQASFQYDRFVLARSITAKVVRGDDTGDIPASVRGSVFGVGVDFDGTLPTGIDEVEIVKVNPTTQEGNQVNFTLDTGADAPKQLIVESLRISGNGSLPFNFDSCAGPTLTPDIPITGTSPGLTPSPSVTPTGTPTPDGTITPTLTPTPCVPSNSIEDGWVYGDILSETSGTWVVDATAFDLGYHIEWGATDGSAGTVLWHSYTVNIGSVNSGSTMDASGTLVPLSSLPQTVQHISLYSPDPLRITFVFEDEGSCTPTPTPSPTISPTPGPSSTPGPTSTAEPLWTACLNFRTNNFSFSGVDATYEEDLGWVQDAGEWSIGRAGVGPAGKKKFKFNFSGSWAGSIRLTNTGGTPATGWKVASGSQFILDFSDQSWTPTQNLYIQFDGNYGPYSLQQICWVDVNPSTATPGAGTGTPLYTRTPIATLTARPNPSRTPVQVPVPIILITSTSGAVITTTPIYGGTGVYSATGTPVMTGTPFGTPAENGTGFGSGGGGFGDVGDMIGFSWQIGWGLFGTLIAYVQQAGDMLGGLVNGFFNSSPQPIPGLPMCISNPTAHDLCAIYYILDWTLLAPSTPGALIIPLLRILIGIWGAIYFIHYLGKIIDRGESVTDAP